jgi:hypothetical protein
VQLVQLGLEGVVFAGVRAAALQRMQYYSFCG